MASVSPIGVNRGLLVLALNVFFFPIIIVLFCTPVRLLLWFIDLILRWQAWLGLRIWNSPKRLINDLKVNTNLYTILRDELLFVDKCGVIKAQCVVDRWVGILRRHIPLGLLCYRTRSRFETPFRWKVLLDIEDEVRVGWTCPAKATAIYSTKETTITSDERDLGSSIMLHYRS